MGWLTQPRPYRVRLMIGPISMATWAPRSFSGSILDAENIQPWALEKVREHTDNFFANDPRFQFAWPDGPAGYTPTETYGGALAHCSESELHVQVLNADNTFRQIYLDGP